jgi:hypothetical protein
MGSCAGRGVPSVTYNFDPDRWYENQRASLEAKLGRGEITSAEFEIALEELERRLVEMESRLDGTFRIPPSGVRPG